jgi:hypothetical protein
MTMALDSDLQVLWCELHDLREAVLPIRLLATEDRPESDAPQPVQHLSDALDDAFGHLQLAIESASTALTDRERRRLSTTLANCNRSLLAFGSEWSDDVSSYHRLRQLNLATRDRGPLWRSWARSAIDGVLSCQTHVHRTHLAVLACWQSLAELGCEQRPTEFVEAKEQ